MKMKKEMRYIQIIAVIAAAVIYLGLRASPLSKSISQSNDFFYVSRVVDGDTLKLSDGQRVRLIGVDTPELHYGYKLLRDAKKSHKDIDVIQGFGRKAADFTKNLVEDRKVRLEYDVEKHDRYRRLLAYVYLEDGTFVNAKIIEEGYGHIMTIPPNVRYASKFLQLEREARKNNKGLWNSEDYQSL